MVKPTRRAAMLLVEHPAIIEAIDCICGGTHDPDDAFEIRKDFCVELGDATVKTPPPLCLVIVCALCKDWHRFNDDGLQEICTR
jgi:hypothetical protein